MKISIVTPAFNSEKYIAETIESVISQRGDFDIEYILMDNNSTDRTAKIIQKYKRLVSDGIYEPKCKDISIKYISQKDEGMYDAINKGFEFATGDIYAWINSDDVYLPGAFDVILRTFKAYPEIRWLKGITSYMNESSNIFAAGHCFLYDRDWIRFGIYGRDAYFIQQESVFWYPELWELVGGINPQLKRAGDYSLWIKFARHTCLYSIKAHVSCFRKVKGQLSEDIDAYRKEYNMIPVDENNYLRKRVKLFFTYKVHIPTQFFKHIFYRLLFGEQKFSLIALDEGEKPVLKTVSYYVVD